MSATTCLVCNSSYRSRIEQMSAEGMSLRDVSAWLEERGTIISHSAIAAHIQKHLDRPYVPQPGEDTLNLMNTYIEKLEKRILNLEAHMLPIVSTDVAVGYTEYEESGTSRVLIYQQDVFAENVGSPETLKEDREKLTSAFVEKIKLERGSKCTDPDEFAAMRAAKLKVQYAKEDAEGRGGEDSQVLRNVQKYLEAGEDGDGIVL